jgi:hypothetical protein
MRVLRGSGVGSLASDQPHGISLADLAGVHNGFAALCDGTLISG